MDSIISDEVREHANALLAEWAKHPSYRHALSLQEGRTEREFVKVAHRMARGDTVSERDQGRLQGWLEALDCFVAHGAQGASEHRKQHERK